MRLTNDGGVTLLSVDNPTSTPIIYCADLYLLGQRKPIPTSIISVKPGISGVEMWEDPIVAINLRKIRVAEANQRQVCRAGR